VTARTPVLCPHWPRPPSSARRITHNTTDACRVIRSLLADLTGPLVPGIDSEALPFGEQP
jgi:hypothetical protein